MQDFNELLAWIHKSHDVISLEKIYVDITGDLIAGLLLSQIIYWHLPDKEGKSKLRVYKDGKWWLAKQRSDWWNEIRITEKQYDRAIRILTQKSIVEVWNTMFNGKKIPHIHLNGDILIKLVNEQIESGKLEISSVLPKSKNRFYPKVKTGIDQKVKPITETTTETIYINYKNENEDGALACAESTPPFNLLNKDIPLDKGITKIIGYYFKVYKRELGEEHPILKPKQYQRVYDTLSSFQCEYDLSLDNWKDMVEHHFERNMETDYNINHFATEGVLLNIMYEVVY